MNNVAINLLFPAVLLAAAVLTTQRADVQNGGEPNRALLASYELQTAGDLAAAAQALRPMVDEQPKAYFPRLRLAYLQLLAADYSNAADSYRAAAALESGAVEPLLGLQQALIAAERYEDAEKAGREVLQRDSKNYLGLSRQAWTLYKRGNSSAAADLYQRVLALYPGDAEMQSGLGYAQLALGKKSAAEANFRQVLANVPGHAGATTGLGYCK